MQVLIVSLPSIAAFVRSGQLRLIAVGSAVRFQELPSVPTISETFPGLSIEGWLALIGPTGIPAEIFERLNREVDRILRDDDVLKQMATFGFSTSDAKTQNQLLERTRLDTERWRKIAADIGLQAQ